MLCRVKTNPMTMAVLTGKLSNQGTMPLSGLSLALPIPFLEDGYNASMTQLENKTPVMKLSAAKHQLKVTLRNLLELIGTQL